MTECVIISKPKFILKHLGYILFFLGWFVWIVCIKLGVRSLLPGVLFIVALIFQLVGMKEPFWFQVRKP